MASSPFSRDAGKEINLSAPQFFNRELSWIEFNARVLDEAFDRSNPLLERLKFLAIVTSNFDEFFMVRVASLKASLRAPLKEPPGSGEAARDPSGREAREVLAAVSRRTREVLDGQYRCLAELLPALAKQGISITRRGDWSPAERRWLDSFFSERVFPLLTPQRLEENDEGGYDRFPSTGNLRLHAAFSLEEEASGAGGAALVQIPPNLDRFVRLPQEGVAGVRLALIEDVVEEFGWRLFPGWSLRESLMFKITRDADAGVDEDRDDDFVAAMEEVLADRQNSWPVRLTFTGSSSVLAKKLQAVFGLEADDVYALPGPIDLRCLMELAQADYIPAPIGSALRYEAWPPASALDVPEGSTIWEEIRKADRLLHLPYESFDLVTRFLNEAADDPNVLAIKMTLYRTSSSSPVLRALTRAARAGKQVAALVELKARFDEAKNIAKASLLEQAGAIVIYGLARLKVHAKAILVVRREENGSIRRYLHLATGNYNDRTARLYEDLSLFTADEELCREASIFFNMITGYSAVQQLKSLAVAPFDLKSRLIAMIERETQRSTKESPGLIVAKLNAIADVDVIKALYAANAAGVRILLNIRGICTLVPGVKGLSENIRVVSVVGRYLEHARVVYFRNGGAEELYLSSADWLGRNLERRVELLFPLRDEKLRGRVRSILQDYFRDNLKARELKSDGSWKRLRPGKGEAPFSAQEALYAATKNRRALAEVQTGELQVRRKPS